MTSSFQCQRPPSSPPHSDGDALAADIIENTIGEGLSVKTDETDNDPDDIKLKNTTLKIVNKTRFIP
jgi:hypothetical protein